ncbi:hypothetical protein [Nocardia sp. XZ_19_385]|uniref:hypothetical protein n=1 Tax=Nocardia sp. XZ_19_385 TaxID=2769488 RepID=UPI00189034CB|nr:hypothetical protein [Nocardia sp. XZ_19_385]
MAVRFCAGDGCRRMLSISVIPGGNPVARADPEHFAVRFLTCTLCRSGFCDRCLPAESPFYRLRACPKCGADLL